MVKHIRITSIITICFFSLSASYGQYSETISSGRPGQAISANTLGSRTLQFQAGADYTGHHFPVTFGTENGTGFGGDVVVRVGITERFELSTGVAYLHQTTERPFLGTNTTSGISSFSVRMRSNVYAGDGAVPAVGFQVGMGLPVGSKDYRPKYVAPQLTLMTGQSFGERWGFSTNWGASWNGNDAIPEGFYVLNVGFSIASFMGTFVEHYGTISENGWNGKVDGGFAFIVNNDLQLDVLGGYGPNGKLDADWFVSTGISWRIRFKERVKKEKS